MTLGGAGGNGLLSEARTLWPGLTQRNIEV